MQFVRHIVSDMKQMNPISKIIFKYGAVLVLALYVASVLTYCLAGRFGDYYGLMLLSEELALTARPCVFLIGIGALLFEAAGPRQEETE